MHLQLDGTETIDDIRTALRHLGMTLAKTGNRTVRRAIQKQQDELLDAELRIKQNQRRPGDC